MADEEILDQNQTVEASDTAEHENDTSTASEDLSPDELKAKLQEAEQKAAENWDQLLRIKAEMENMRRRTQRDLENAHKYALEKFNLQELNPQGEKFNPEHHQAMSLQENAEVEANTVLAVMQKGYLLNDRLVRPAMVLVSKAPENKA